VVAFTACQTARTLSPNLLSPNLCGDVDIGRLGLAHPSAKLREHRRAALDDAVAELRRLIREGFESGIPARSSPRRPGCQYRALPDPRRAAMSRVRPSQGSEPKRPLPSRRGDGDRLLA
jgi:hypothetical protein